MRGIFGNKELHTSVKRNNVYDAMLYSKIDDAAYYYNARYHQLSSDFDTLSQFSDIRQYKAARLKSGYLIDLSQLIASNEITLQIVDIESSDTIIGIIHKHNDVLEIYSNKNIKLTGFIQNTSCQFFSEKTIEVDANIDSENSIELFAENIIFNKHSTATTEHLAISSAQTTQLHGIHKSRLAEITASLLDQNAIIQADDIFYITELTQHNGQSYAKQALSRTSITWLSSHDSLVHTSGVIESNILDCVDQGHVSCNQYEGVISQYVLNAEFLCGSGRYQDLFSLKTSSVVTNTKAQLILNCNLTLNSDWIVSLDRGIRINSNQQRVDWKLIANSFYQENKLLSLIFNSEDPTQSLQKISASDYSNFYQSEFDATQKTHKLHHAISSGMSLDIGGASHLGTVDQSYQAQDISLKGDVFAEDELLSSTMILDANHVQLQDEIDMSNAKVTLDGASAKVLGSVKIEQFNQKGRDFTLEESAEFKAEKAYHDLSGKFKIEKNSNYETTKEAYIRANSAYTRGIMTGKKLMMEADIIINRGRVYYDNQVYFAKLYISTGILIASESIQTNALAVLRLRFIKTPYDCVTSLLNINATLNIHFGKPLNMDLRRKVLFAANSILTLSSFLIPGAAGICSLIKIPVNILPQLANILSSYSQFKGMFDGRISNTTQLISKIERIIMMGTSLVLGVLGGVTAAEHFSSKCLYAHAPLLEPDAFRHLDSIDAVLNSPVVKCANALSAALSSISGRTSISLIDLDACGGIIASDIKYNAVEVSVAGVGGLTGSTTSAFVADFGHNGDILGHSTRSYFELSNLDTDTLIGVNQIATHHLDVYSDCYHHPHQAVTADEAVIHGDIELERSTLNVTHAILQHDLTIKKSSYTGHDVENKAYFKLQQSSLHLEYMQNGDDKPLENKVTLPETLKKVDLLAQSEHMQVYTNAASQQHQASETTQEKIVVDDKIHKDHQPKQPTFESEQSQVHVHSIDNEANGTYIEAGDHVEIDKFENKGTKLLYSSKGVIKEIENSGKEQNIQSKIDTDHETITGNGLTADDLDQGSHRYEVDLIGKDAKFDVRATSQEKIDHIRSKEGSRTVISESKLVSVSIETDEKSKFEIDDSQVDAQLLKMLGHVDAQNSKITTKHYEGPIEEQKYFARARGEVDAIIKNHSSSATGQMKNWSTDHVEFHSDVTDKKSDRLDTLGQQFEKLHQNDIGPSLEHPAYKETVNVDGSLKQEYGSNANINGYHTYDTVVPVHIHGKHGKISGQIYGSGPVFFESDEGMQLLDLDASIEGDITFVTNGILSGTNFNVFSDIGRVTYSGDQGIKFDPKITHHVYDKKHHGVFHSSHTHVEWDTVKQNTTVAQDIVIESKCGSVHTNGSNFGGARVTIHAKKEIVLEGTKTHTTIDHKGRDGLYFTHDYVERDNYTEAYVKAFISITIHSDESDVIKTGIEVTAPTVIEHGKHIINQEEKLTTTVTHKGWGITASVAGFQLSGPDCFNPNYLLDEIQGHEQLIGSAQLLIKSDNPVDFATAAVKLSANSVNTYNHITSGIRNGTLGKELINRAGLNSFSVGVGYAHSVSMSQTTSHGAGVNADNYVAEATESIEVKCGAHIKANHGALHAPHVKVEGAELDQHSKGDGFGALVTGSLSYGINGGNVSFHGEHAGGIKHENSSAEFNTLYIETKDADVTGGSLIANETTGHIGHALATSYVDAYRSESIGVSVGVKVGEDPTSVSASFSTDHRDDAVIGERSSLTLGNQSGLTVDSLHNIGADSDIKPIQITETGVEEHRHHTGMSTSVSIPSSHSSELKNNQSLKDQGLSRDVVSIPFEGRYEHEEYRAHDDSSGRHIEKNSKQVAALVVPTINQNSTGELSGGFSDHSQVKYVDEPKVDIPRIQTPWITPDLKPADQDIAGRASLDDELIYPEDSDSWEVAAREGFKAKWQRQWDYQVGRIGAGLEDLYDDTKSLAMLVGDAASIAVYPIFHNMLGSVYDEVFSDSVERMEERGKGLWEHTIKPAMEFFGDAMTMSALSNTALQQCNPKAQQLYDEASQQMQHRAKIVTQVASDWLNEPLSEQIGDVLESATHYGPEFFSNSRLAGYMHDCYGVELIDIDERRAAQIIARKSSYVYRGTYELPEDVFRFGMKAYGDDMDIHHHIAGYGHGDPEEFDVNALNSGFVSTSESRQVAAQFPLRAYIDGVDRRYVYLIRRPDNAIDLVNDFYYKDEGYLKDPDGYIEDHETFISEREHAVPGQIAPEDIIGVWPVDLHGSWFDEQGRAVCASSDGTFDASGLLHREIYAYGNFLKNPFFSGTQVDDLIDAVDRSLRFEIPSPSTNRYSLFGQKHEYRTHYHTQSEYSSDNSATTNSLNVGRMDPP